MSRYGSIVGFPYSAGIGPYNFDEFDTTPNTRTSINENNALSPPDTSVSFLVKTHGIKTDYKLYWSTQIVTGTITAANFTDNKLFGEFFVGSNGEQTIPRTLVDDSLTNTTPKSFRIVIRLGNPITGGIMIKSKVITINDTSLTPLTATLNAAVPNPIVQVINRASYPWDLFYPPVTGGLVTGYAFAAPSLPNNIGSINPTTGILTGTPTVTSTTPISYTVNVTQNYAIPYQYARPASISFNMVVASTLTAAVNTGEFTASGIRYIPPLGQTLTPFTPVIPNGGWTGSPAGSIPYNFTLNTALPPGVVQNPSTGQITGAATGQGTGQTKTYINTIKDNATNNGYTDAQTVSGTNTTFKLQVPFFLSFNATITNRMFVVGTPITTFKPVSVNPITGSPNKTYILSTSLSGTGLSYDEATGNLSGTPLAVQASKSYTVDVSDECQPPQNGTRTFTMGFSAVLTTTLVQTTTRFVGVSTLITPFKPVDLSGGHLPSWVSPTTPALPSGLSIDPSTGIISGTTSGTSDVDSVLYRVDVTDQSTPPQSSAATFKSFRMQVVPTLVANRTIATRITVVGNAVNYAPITGIGGSLTKTYGIKSGTTTLPNPLLMGPTGAITGTPTTATNPQTLITYTARVTDTCQPQQGAENTFQLAISPVLIISLLNTIIYLRVGTATSFPALSIQGGWLPLTVTPSQALSGTLAIAQDRSGIISGTASSTVNSASYQFTVIDSTSTAQNKTTSTLSPSTLVINTVAALTGSVINPSRIIAVGQSVNYPPLSVQGGGGTLTYASTPTLPNGLQFVNGFIVGAAIATSTNTSYNITVIDQCTPTQQIGISPNPLLTTSIQVVGALVVTPNPSIPILTEGVAFTTFPTVTVSGGTSTKTYSISPALPNGLVFNTTNGQITGATPTITNVRSSQSYTVRVTDGCTVPQDVTSASFNITVRAAAQIVFNPTFVANNADTTATYSWVVPAGVTSISMVCVGGGGAAGSSVTVGAIRSAGGAGGGGALAYRNNISVTPGSTITIIAGGGGATAGANSAGGNGGTSSVTVNGSLVCAATGGTGGRSGSLGTGGAGGTVVAGTGGVGGKGGDALFNVNATWGSPGGGGAGGYNGAGGAGGNSISGGGSPLTSGTNAAAGSGAGGGGCGGNFYVNGGGGGGVGLLGIGTDGIGGTGVVTSIPLSLTSGAGRAIGGTGGSGGAIGGSGFPHNGGSGYTITTPYYIGGQYGGGSSGNGIYGSNGGVRIMWPGNTRAYPSTGTADQIF